MRERMIRMRAPTLILHDQCLFADIRLLLSRWPALAYRPERLAEMLDADEYDVRACLEALQVEDLEVLV